MFDQKEIESYRNIKVPSELKTRILADCNAESARGKRNIGGALPRSGMIRSLSAIAACLVLAVARHLCGLTLFPVQMWIHIWNNWVENYSTGPVFWMYA